MEQRLYDAAIAGEASLLRLIEEVPLLLDKASLICQDKNPLHIAAMFGHVNFVKKMLENNSNMCFAPDRFGRNPLHLAAIGGKLDVLKVLLDAEPLAAREKTAGGDTVLHLCIKYNQLEALKNLVETIKDREFPNMKNGDGMTVLHLAVCNKRKETINYLLENKKVDVNALNANGNTALDLLPEPKSHIAQSLKAAGAKKGKKIAPQKMEWLTKKRESLMIVASLIATMTFQAAVSPPGGVWQDDLRLSNETKLSNDTKPHTAGKAVMSYNDDDVKYYVYFVRANTVAFVSSLSIILLLIGGLPFQSKKFFTWALTVIMWMTVTSAALTYWVAIILLTPSDKSSSTLLTMIAVMVWSGVMAVLFLGTTIRLFDKWLKFGDKNLSSIIRHWYWAVPEETNDNQEDNQVQTTDKQEDNQGPSV